MGSEYKHYKSVIFQMKAVKIFLIVGFIIVLLFFGYMWIYSALTHNAFRTKIEISEEEKKFIKRVQNECNCELKYSYDVLAEDPNFFSVDKRFFLELRSYDEHNNWCIRDSIFIKEKASMLIKDFISTSKYSYLFEDISLVLIVYKDIGEEEKLIQTICHKRVEFNLQSGVTKYIE